MKFEKVQNENLICLSKICLSFVYNIEHWIVIVYMMNVLETWIHMFVDFCE